VVINVTRQHDHPTVGKDICQTRFHVLNAYNIISTHILNLTFSWEVLNRKYMIPQTHIPPIKNKTRCFFRSIWDSVSVGIHFGAPVFLTTNENLCYNIKPYRSSIIPGE